TPQFWNAVVAYLSGGLLYGKEVECPEWLTSDRKRAYAPRAGARPAWRRERVRELMLAGRSYKQIAAELEMRIEAVYVHAWRVHKQLGLRGRGELMRRMGKGAARV